MAVWKRFLKEVGIRVESMIRWCHTGPTAARVKDVVVEYEEPEGLLGFKIERSMQ
jgi:acylphosphatase